MVHGRSLKALALSALLAAAVLVTLGVAAAQQGTSGSATGTGTGSSSSDFKQDLPTEAPELPAPPLVRPQGSFISLAFSQGGTIFWILLVLGLGGIFVAAERLLTLGRGRVDVSRFMGDVIKALNEKGVNGALEVCAGQKGPVVQVVQYGLQRANRGPEGVEKAVATASLSHLIGMRRGLGILSFVGQSAPLLGFLGTVMGLLHAFDAALDSGRVNAAQAIGGISEAVITTSTGIAIGILANVCINLISARIDRLSVQMEEAGDELVDSLSQAQGRLKGRTA